MVLLRSDLLQKNSRLLNDFSTQVHHSCRRKTTHCIALGLPLKLNTTISRVHTTLSHRRALSCQLSTKQHSNSHQWTITQRALTLSAQQYLQDFTKHSTLQLSSRSDSPLGLLHAAHLSSIFWTTLDRAHSATGQSLNNPSQQPSNTRLNVSSTHKIRHGLQTR